MIISFWTLIKESSPPPQFGPGYGFRGLDEIAEDSRRFGFLFQIVKNRYDGDMILNDRCYIDFDKHTLCTQLGRVKVS